MSYSRSKLAIVMWTYRLQRELTRRDMPVTVNCLHPGMVDTDLYRNGWPIVVYLKRYFTRLFFKVLFYFIIMQILLSGNLGKNMGCV